MPTYLPTHIFAGSDPERQSVGYPGHCERCARVGHVAAHPELGCGDVGCYKEHGPDDPMDRVAADSPSEASMSATSPIVAWMKAWNEGVRASSADRRPQAKRRMQRTRNPYDQHSNFTLHYWWARGNQGHARPVDNYGSIPRQVANEDLGR